MSKQKIINSLTFNIFVLFDRISIILTTYVLELKEPADINTPKHLRFELHQLILRIMFLVVTYNL